MPHATSGQINKALKRRSRRGEFWRSWGKPGAKSSRFACELHLDQSASTQCKVRPVICDSPQFI